MKIGFTGTQHGMTAYQKDKLRSLLIELLMTPGSIEEGHHGDCIGGDEEFHQICLDLKIPVVLHPPIDEYKRAFCKGALRELPPYPYLVRNSHIIVDTEAMIGAPRSRIEPSNLRGQGTWSTILRARKAGKLHRILYPEPD